MKNRPWGRNFFNRDMAIGCWYGAGGGSGMTPGWVSSSLRARTIDFVVGLPFFKSKFRRNLENRPMVKSRFLGRNFKCRDMAVGCWYEAGRGSGMTPGWVSSSLGARTVDFGLCVPFFKTKFDEI